MYGFFRLYLRPSKSTIETVVTVAYIKLHSLTHINLQKRRYMYIYTSMTLSFHNYSTIYRCIANVWTLCTLTILHTYMFIYKHIPTYTFVWRNQIWIVYGNEINCQCAVLIFIVHDLFWKCGEFSISPFKGSQIANLHVAINIPI